MKAQRLQAAYARRREADFDRIEKTEAVNKYFDHWSKVTSRFEAWTDPEYYQQAEESLRKEKEKKSKEQNLNERRVKLKHLLDTEKKCYEEELKELDKPKPKKLPNDLLDKIHKDQQYIGEEKRRLELESKLYGKWRYGINDENILFDSKTDNQTLAKLNWLDKQIENRMLREEEERTAEERQIKLLEETRKREENLKEQQKIREASIKELRSMQESNLSELKTYDLQSNSLREKEIQLRNNLEKIENEMKQLKARKMVEPKMEVPNNIKRVKMFIRNQSEQYRDDLQEDLNILKRILVDYYSEDTDHLRKQFELMLRREIEKQTIVEGMYESEAKHDLISSQEKWSQFFKDRETQVSWILHRIKKNIQNELGQNVTEQKRLIEIRQALVTSLEHSNRKLKAITNEAESFVESHDLVDASSSVVGEKDEGVVALRPESASDNGNSPRRPQFGRKKVAWT